ncbi:MAG: cell division protein ZapA [Muribaculaceae bacterium]|nr:cell division protein ZapA [Muribaculaceae bacterium]
MNDKLNINLRIADVVLSLLINRDEEELLREVAKEVNHVYDSYTRRFPKSSPREVMAKVTLLFAKGYITMAERSKELDAILEHFEADLDRMLDTEA